MAARVERSPCPCGSGETLPECCGLYLSDGRQPPTAEALMRARYTAFACSDAAFIRRSWHPDTCPDHIGGTDVTWTGLDIVHTAAGHALDRTGTVRFVAHYRDGVEHGALRETSRFERIGMRWVYVDGTPA